MRLPSGVKNACLATLLIGSGISTLEQFAQQVNHVGFEQFGLQLDYDRRSVCRWLKGSECRNPDVVAHVLSRAWGVPIPAAVIWPSSRNGAPPVPIHQHPWVAEHTVAELSTVLRRDVLADHSQTAARVVDGTELITSLRRWLATEPGRLPARLHGTVEVTSTIVDRLDALTRHLVAAASAVGGQWVRDATVGHLRSGVELLQHGRYDTKVGNQLLAVVADLAGAIAELSLDAGRPEAAQQYAILGLQAAHECTHRRGAVIAAAILTGLAAQQTTAGRPDHGLAVLDLATGRLDRADAAHAGMRAEVAARRTRLLAAVDAGQVRSAHSLAYLPASLTIANRPVGSHATATGRLLND